MKPELSEKQADVQSTGMRLSLCMIVRDNEGTIEACLESVQPWVDEMIVVDTGSTDGTPEIVQRFGARRFQFPWCDDFSAARNESLKRARGEWIFWIDSDETIDPRNGQKLRELACGPHEPSVFGYVMQQVHPRGGPDSGELGVAVVDQVRMFRNGLGLRFEGRVHEQMIPGIQRAGGQLRWADVAILHSGMDTSPEARKDKSAFYFRILAEELEEKPDHPFVLFNTGMTHAAIQEYDKALPYLRRCIEVSRPQGLHVRKAYALLIRAESMGGQHEMAWMTCEKGLLLFPNDKELLFHCGLLHQHFGRLKEAEGVYLRILTEEVPRHLAGMDHGIHSFKTRQNLAVVYTRQGTLDKAEQQWRRILEEQPLYHPGWRGLAKTLLAQGRREDVGKLAEQLKAHPTLGDVGRQVAVWLASQGK